MGLAGLAYRAFFGRKGPVVSGDLSIAGPEKPIRIRRDRWAVPHIEAAGERDAWFGLGFCQGQDRALQLELLMRVGRGTLSELVGREGLIIDRLCRRIGFSRAAKAQLSVLDPAIRANLEAFAAGVNSGRTAGLPASSSDFQLLRSRPSSFFPEDCLSVMGLMSFSLASNWDAELMRLKVLEADGSEALAALGGGYPHDLPVSIPPGALAGRALNRMAAELRALREATGFSGSSNNWALSPGRTASGRPILANDPHLPPDIPSQWYLAHRMTTGWAAAGAAFVGGPAIAIGHNGCSAWGVTAGFVDNTDLFLEEVGPDGKSVRGADGFVPCEVRRERISVRGGKTVEEEVLVTPRGPLIGPYLAGGAGSLSLRAVWLDSLPVRGLLCVHRARTFDEFRKNFAEWPFLPLNLAYADAAGNIGWQLAARPLAQGRRDGAAMGADPEAGWDGWCLFRPCPVENPEGFVASANNKPLADGDGAFEGDWLDGFRMARICEALGERRGWDRESTARLQMDLESLPWRRLRQSVMDAPDSDPRTKRAQDLLREWDGKVAADSPAAAVFEFFVSRMSRRAVEAKAPHSAPWVLGKGSNPLSPFSELAALRAGRLAELMIEQPRGWFQKSWPEEIAAALAQAVADLQKRFGPDPTRWAWGRIRTLTFRNPLGSKAPLGGLFNRGPFPWGGDASHRGPGFGRPFLIPRPTHYVPPPARCWTGGMGILPLGPSGRTIRDPASPHYDDLLPLYLKGEGVATLSSEVVRSATVNELRLTRRRPRSSLPARRLGGRGLDQLLEFLAGLGEAFFRGGQEFFGVSELKVVRLVVRKFGAGVLHGLFEPHDHSFQ